MAVLSLEQIRERNFRRLQGLDGDAKVFIPWTAEEIISSAEKCWEVISLVTRKKTVEVTGKNGKKYTRPSDELQYPIYHAAIVGQQSVLTTTEDNKKKRVKVERDNLTTMRELYQMRTKIGKLYGNENSETYAAIYKAIGNALDGYANQVVSDELQYQEGFLDKLNEARKQEAEVRSKNKGDKSDSE